MGNSVKHIVIVGGGTAGWLTACLLAAKHRGVKSAPQEMKITLIESDTVAPIGVGEGTWPTMRATLARIGISEQQLFSRANAAFKQASKFVDWHRNASGDSYYHPFSAPQGSARIDITPYWLSGYATGSYADDVCFQPHICELGLGPRPLQDNNGQSANYGYHLDAGLFVQLLRDHAVTQLGVQHIVDDVNHVVMSDNQGIEAVHTSKHGPISGQLFVDCSGFKGLLIGEALNVELQDCSDTLFADCALVCQQPYSDPHQPIKCYTQSTAQSAGWIWDIGLQNRRGVGHVFSTHYLSTDQATAQLLNYLGDETGNTSVREIRFSTGYRKRFWHKNCVAIGLSAGFLEPLEASALMLIERSATLLTDQLPATIQVMNKVARRFNQILEYQWQQTIAFLKLHYVLSNRDEAFWRANRNEDTIPAPLLDLLDEWRYRPPLDSDFSHVAEVFPAQSYRYILYGMQASTDPTFLARTLQDTEQAQRQFSLNRVLSEQLSRNLPSHRTLIEFITKNNNKNM
ncbi:tryptophan 7-halogenase [Alteromonas aestuariivivens]|uniref:Tryptophan 7-halogenase n=1 Tax=Alteromonas aestuariivivens TaxID=1938339 RepID=A0A3D8MDT4_9ALTE|nr:tryptophan halogenase family protein [Alteromonas aestuariivivens]RDV29019.1 tryptophan 7-halogenase [Alteromonas aestuariivivens]